MFCILSSTAYQTCLRYSTTIWSDHVHTNDRDFSDNAYPSGGVGVMTQQYQVPTTQNIEAGAQLPPYKK